MTRAAVVGCGDVAGVHLAALAAMADVELVGVCDVVVERAAEAARAAGTEAFEDHHRLLEQARPDVVHVCTPHDQHHEVAVEALDRGVHVVVEKPVAHDLAAARRVVEAAHRSGAKSAVCFQNRYRATVRELHRMLADGEVGRVLGAHANLTWHRSADYYRARAWRGDPARSGGGVLINQAIHTVDLLQWLLGDVEQASGRLSRQLAYVDVGVEDTAAVALHHAGGLRSVLMATVAGVVDSPVEITVVAEHATLRLDDALTVTWTDGSTRTVLDSPGSSVGRTSWGVSHADLIRDFYDALHVPDRFWIGPDEGLSVLGVVLDVYRSDGSRPSSPPVPMLAVPAATPPVRTATVPAPTVERH